MTLIAHISDIHLSPLPTPNFGEFFSKRITGFINWKLKREKFMKSETINRLVEHLKKQNPDHIALTGDLVNLSTKKEFENARKWLDNFAPAQKLALIAGNHDAYVKGSLEKFQKIMGDYIKGEMIEKAPFPFVRRIKNVALINCNSAIATPPFMAFGKFDKEQAKRLALALNLTKKAGYFRIVTIHHPPFEEEAKKFKKGLRGAKLFREIIEQEGAELILHGHTHKSTINAIKGNLGDEVPVIGVAAASAHALSGADPARYNLFEIEKMGNKFSCTMSEMGYQRIGDEISMRLKMRIY